MKYNRDHKEQLERNGIPLQITEHPQKPNRKSPKFEKMRKPLQTYNTYVKGNETQVQHSENKSQSSGSFTKTKGSANRPRIHLRDKHSIYLV